MSAFRIALLFGGPSAERGISMNSARSVADHLEGVEIVPIYFNLKKEAYLIGRECLYSNTPSDFDFKIKTLGRLLDEPELIAKLQSVHLTFPVIHGAFGEGGELQALLEKHQIPFIGSGSQASTTAFDKFDASWLLERKGFHTLPSLLLEGKDADANLARVESFFQNNQLERAILKPARSGSSIGVTEVTGPEQCLRAYDKMLREGIDTRFVLEPFAAGKEFTVIVLQTPEGKAVALLPTEIEITDRQQTLFDYRMKYLPTRQVAYHMPPRFEESVVETIRRQAADIFTGLNLEDVARIDGWVLEDGNIWFSDINLTSGMEQNSFIFQQAACLGWSHSTILRYLISTACQRYGIAPPEPASAKREAGKEPVRVLFGGDSSERQVSLMSGSNVWLKLRNSDRYVPYPYLLDVDGFIWSLPYPAALRHTVEEVVAACRQILEEGKRLEKYQRQIVEELDLEAAFEPEPISYPVCLRLEDFLADKTAVFLAIHGGIGENGELQEALAKAKVPFTGSLSATARLCMDKYKTGKALENHDKHGIFVAAKRKLDTRTLLNVKDQSLKKIWDSLVEDLKSRTLIIKPLSDGCSSGIVRLGDLGDLTRYLTLLAQGRPRILPGELSHVGSPVEMPTEIPQFLLFESFVRSDRPRIQGTELDWESHSGWVEVTVGVTGGRGQVKALKPSITVAGGEILSLEEKFQGGTGVNITPPPEPWVSQSAWEQAQRKIEFVANKLGINGFARIDAFMQIESGNILVIEANSIPGLTPSTVIFHQALAEDPPLPPTRFLELILDNRNFF